MDSDIVTVIKLIETDERYLAILKKILDYHNKNINDKYYKDIGFDYADVSIPGRILYKLFELDILKVVDRGRRTSYLPKNPEAIDKAIQMYEEGRKPEEKMETHELTTDYIKNVVFKDIVGYDDIKDLLARALVSKVSVLLIGPPASCKSLMLEALDRLPDAELVLGSRASKAGLADFLIIRKPRILLIDEIDKMNREDHAVLLSLIQSGIVKETLYRRKRSVELDTVVIAAANRINKLPVELKSRFQIIQLSRYTYDEFKKIVKHILPAWEGVNQELAEYIATKIWYDLMSMDVRDAVKVARLVKLNQSKEEVDRIISILKKYKYKPETYSI